MFLTEEIIEKAVAAMNIVPDDGSAHDYARAALSAVLPDIIEECARVASDSVTQKCCQRYQVLIDPDGNPYGEACCGLYDFEPMYPDEVAARIRDLKERGLAVAKELA